MFTQRLDRAINISFKTNIPEASLSSLRNITPRMRTCKSCAGTNRTRRFSAPYNDRDYCQALRELQVLRQHDVSDWSQVGVAVAATTTTDGGVTRAQRPTTAEERRSIAGLGATGRRQLAVKMLTRLLEGYDDAASRATQAWISREHVNVERAHRVVAVRGRSAEGAVSAEPPDRRRHPGWIRGVSGAGADGPGLPRAGGRRCAGPGPG
jgi:hypothetical protein